MLIVLNVQTSECPFANGRLGLHLCFWFPWNTGRSAEKTDSRSIPVSDRLSSISSTALGQSVGSSIGNIEDACLEGQILEIPNLRIFTFAELKSATRNFNPETVLGEGGFGRVYKGWVDKKTLNPTKSGVGIIVAVKKLNPESVQGLEEWQVICFIHFVVTINENVLSLFEDLEVETKRNDRLPSLMSFLSSK